MTEVNFRYCLSILLNELADAQIIIDSKVEECKNLSHILGIPFETLLADEFKKLWVERSDNPCRININCPTIYARPS